MSKGYTQILKDNDSTVRAMKAKGCTTYEIADVLGIESPDAIRHYCSVNKIKLEDGAILRNDAEDVVARIREASDGRLEYISGYETKDSQVLVRCNVCGGEFVRTYHHLTTHKPVVCPCCIEAKREAIRAELRQEREAKREARLEIIARHKAEAERKRIERETPHACPVCGCMTTRPVYCSSRCALKADNKTKDNRRRAKIQNAMVDKDITVRGLFIRDNGVCQICGEPCDTSDYIIKDGYKVCGNNYPSIDHIIPLAKGGQHSWDNVQLAHRICNTRKSDHLYG